MNILEYLEENRIYFAGATGSELLKMGMKSNESSSDWNITHPDEITSLHKSYLDAGSNALTTSTFTANRVNYPQGKDLEELVSKSFELCRAAKEQSGKECFIGLNIGPIGKLLEPLGTFKRDDARKVFSELSGLADENKAEFILIETMNEFSEAEIALESVRSNTTLPVMISFTFSKFGRLLNGETVEDCIKMAEELGADVVGANCSLGPSQLLDIAKRIKACTKLPVMIEPNAGLPVQRGDKVYYDVNADEFSDVMKEIADLGVECLGGCCGTSPEYISKMIKKVEER